MTGNSTPSDASYLASMYNSPSQTARAKGYDFGPYLLEMACLEFTQLHEIAEPELGRHA
jgi:hypothetical protein